MKRTKYFFIILSLVFGCSQPNSFEKYLESLNDIPTTLKHSGFESLPRLSSDYDTTLFYSYKHKMADEPFGILERNNYYVAIMDFYYGDLGSAPLLVTYEYGSDYST